MKKWKNDSNLQEIVVQQNFKLPTQPKISVFASLSVSRNGKLVSAIMKISTLCSFTLPNIIEINCYSLQVCWYHF